MSSLRNQVLGLVIALVLVTSVTILTLFWYNTTNFTRTTVAREITSATESFEQLLKTRENTLANSAALLTADFGFKQAVATRDEATIESVLLNHGNRVGADLMFVTDLRGQLIAATHSALEPGTPLPFPKVLENAVAAGTSISIIEFRRVLYQLVVLPIRAPRPIAFAAVGFRFDEEVATELKLLTGLDVSLRIYGTEERVVSTLDDAYLQAAMRAPATVDPWFGVPFVDVPRFVSQRQPLAGTPDDVGELMLSARLDEQFDAFLQLRDEVFLTFFIVLIIAAAGATLFANTIARPLNRLVGTAMRMARGSYDAELAGGRRTREVRALFQAFREMGQDIKKREETIRWQAEHDELTGLVSRHRALEEISVNVVDAGKQAVVISFLIDGLRDISDALGPEVADEFVRVIGERLKASRASLVSARLGTNEFAQVIRLGETDDAETACHHALESLQRPVQIQDMALRRTVRAGYTLSPADGDSAETLMKRASIAVERANQEQVAVRRYAAGEEEEQVNRLRIINDLKSALGAEDGQLFMVYQPKLNLKSGRIDKLEALIRWIHPELGFVSPEEFITLAEQSSLIVELTDWVIRTVIRQRAEWQQRYPALQIAINVSAQDLEHDDIVDRVVGELERHSLAAASLCFEMTERDIMNNADKTASTMARLKALGFEFSVDDYGIGQSSLSKLKQLPIDEIKIDKAFIMTLDQSESDRIIADSTIELGHRFGLQVIAEGVESAAAESILAGFGCDYIQGYYLSKPLPAAEVVPWLEAFERTRSAAPR